MTNFGYDTFISPLTWRYGSAQMRSLWSEENKRKTLRHIWVVLAEVQSKVGLVTQEQLKELKEHESQIDIERASAIEASIHHDLMAEIKTYAEQCPTAGGIIHLGATSMDIEDNMDAIRLKDSLAIIINKLKELLKAFENKIRETSDLRCMAFTHIQSAEPTTVGYRLSFTAQDLLESLKELSSIIIKGKGFKGAVGTAASYESLLEGTTLSFEEFEKQAMDLLGLPAFDVSTQVYPRRQDLVVVQALSRLCSSLSKFALDFRILQSSSVGEFNEFFSQKQVGSSAMPFKRNPINSEKICSLCRIVRSYEVAAWDNSSQSILERTLDDSADRRIFLPGVFLATDEILDTMIKLVSRMIINKETVQRNFDKFSPFAATEKLLMKLGKAGADRQAFHEVIREHSLNAWAQVQMGKENSLNQSLCSDPRVLEYLSKDQILEALNAQGHLGIAPRRALFVADLISSAIK